MDLDEDRKWPPRRTPKSASKYHIEEEWPNGKWKQSGSYPTEAGMIQSFKNRKDNWGKLRMVFPDGTTRYWIPRDASSSNQKMLGGRTLAEMLKIILEGTLDRACLERYLKQEENEVNRLLDVQSKGRKPPRGSIRRMKSNIRLLNLHLRNWHDPGTL